MSGSKRHLRKESFRYDRMIGTGGIGTGMFFLMEGNHTLGRNESRAAKLVPFKDYCKLHIIFHYVAILLGAAHDAGFKMWPIGKVGDDELGQMLLHEMKQVGMETSYVHMSPMARTLLSICFQYPDSTGGNITTSNSASEQIFPVDIKNAFSSIKHSSGRTVVLAVPEVPVESRVELLHEGRKERAFNAASLLVSEIEEFERLGGFQATDYLSVNIDEAKAIAGCIGESEDSRFIVNECIKKLTTWNNNIFISITDGPKGSYGYHRGDLEFIPPLRVKALGTGGAGDAFLAGTLAGIICGLPFLKKKENHTFGETPLESALELGTLVASYSVTSQDTIHQSLHAESVMKHALDYNIVFSEQFQTIFP